MEFSSLKYTLGERLTKRLTDQMFLVMTRLRSCVDATETLSESFLDQPLRLIFLPRSAIDECGLIIVKTGYTLIG
jgi:hypothetical protein